MNKVILYIVACLSLICVGCNDLCNSLTVTTHAPSLRTMQRIQDLQFICVEHPEYRYNFPNELKQIYTKLEINQVYNNLKWGEYNYDK